jgi:phosphoribosylanthranilate isomerase
MTWIKICGITNLEDAKVAVDAGADALGFVFYEKSPRNIDPDTARDIVAQLPADVEKVGVFVDEPAKRIREIAQRASLTGAQLHGDPTNGTALQDLDSVQERFGISKLILVISGEKLTKDGFFISEHLKQRIYAILLDSGSSSQPGGTGNRFDWSKTYSMAQALSLMVPVIVAGGLDPSNVGEAVKLFRPYGVDVASGVEGKPGKKDVQKVNAFVKAVREAGKTS